jgi:hypothetical protein
MEFGLTEIVAVAAFGGGGGGGSGGSTFFLPQPLTATARSSVIRTNNQVCLR